MECGRGLQGGWPGQGCCSSSGQSGAAPEQAAVGAWKKAMGNRDGPVDGDCTPWWLTWQWVGGPGKWLLSQGKSRVSAERSGCFPIRVLALCFLYLPRELPFESLWGPFSEEHTSG